MMKPFASLVLLSAFFISQSEALQCYTCVGASDEECNRQGTEQCPGPSDACAVIRGQSSGIMKSCSYRYLLSAPFAVLGGLSPREKEVAKTRVPLHQRYFRRQAGLTNRWQFSFSPSCDLLGIAQANKAVRVGLNETLMRIMSDVTLECLGFQWDLHRMYLFKSQVLANLLASAVLDHGMHYTDNRTVKETRCYKRRLLAGRDNKKLSERKQKIPKVTLVLDIDNPDVTRFAFAAALKNLYNSQMEVNEEDVLEILATASELQFPSLFQKCAQVMRSSISPANVCSYYSAGCKYKQPSLISDCERWIEVNLVIQLGSQIHLRKLPLELLQKMLRSSRLV
uniref:Uncharacterized protein n=1 Tax=Sphaerodactylus townsendi TaxID=933632 RepID=A0ACB8FA12_9SAUR